MRGRVAIAGQPFLVLRSRWRAAGSVLAGLALAACGIKGTPPVPKDPKAVSDLRIEGRDGAVRVSWKGRTAGGVTAFDVLRRVESKSGTVYFERLASLPPAGTRRYAYYDRTPAVGTTYVYRVRPRQREPEPSELRFTGPQGLITWVEAPDAPTDVKSVPLNAGARLSWNPAPGVDGYRVYELDADKTPKSEPANRGLIDKTSWVAVALPDGKGVCYAVRAVKLPERLAEARNAVITEPDDSVEAPSGAEVGDAAAVGLVIPRGNAGREMTRAVSELAGEGPLPGLESASSEITCTTPGLTEPPPPPKRLTAAILADGVSLTWHNSPGEEVVGYHVERQEMNADGTPKDKTYVRLTDEKPVNAVGYIDRDVQKGASYRYQVRAIDAAGAEGPASTPTKTVRFNP